MSLVPGQNPRHKTLCRQPANRNPPREIGLSRLRSTIDTRSIAKPSIPLSFASILVPFFHLPLLLLISLPCLLDSSTSTRFPLFRAELRRSSRGHLAPFSPFSMININRSLVDRFSKRNLYFLEFWRGIKFLKGRRSKSIEEFFLADSSISKVLKPLIGFFSVPDTLSTDRWTAVYHRLWDLRGLYRRAELPKTIYGASSRYIYSLKFFLGDTIVYIEYVELKWERKRKIWNNECKIKEGSVEKGIRVDKYSWKNTKG